MRHSAEAWSGKTSEVPFIPFLCIETGQTFRCGPSRKGQWTKNAKYEYCCCVGHICLHIIMGS